MLLLIVGIKRTRDSLMFVLVVLSSIEVLYDVVWCGVVRCCVVVLYWEWRVEMLTVFVVWQSVVDSVRVSGGEE